MCIAPRSFPLNFFTLQSLLLHTTPKYIKFPILPKLQTMYQSGYVLWCDIPILPLEQIIRKKRSLSMHSFTVAIINSSYMFQLWNSHHQALYVRSIKGNFTPVVYIYLKIISGRYFGLTYKGMWMLHTNKHL